MNTLEQEFMDNYDENASHILKHIYFRVNNWELAEDLTQETFFKAWGHIVSNGEKINNLKTFTYRIAHNLIIDHYRRKPRIPLSILISSKHLGLSVLEQTKEEVLRNGKERRKGRKRRAITIDSSSNNRSSGGRRKNSRKAGRKRTKEKKSVESYRRSLGDRHIGVFVDIG